MNKSFKTLVAIIILLSCTVQGHSQILMALIFGDKLNSDKLEFGLTLGNNFSTISNLDTAGNTKWLLKGWNVGLFFNIKLTDKFYLHVAAIPKSTSGFREFPTYATGDSTLDGILYKFSVKRKVNYIHVPMLVRYKTTKGFFCEAGPEINLRTKARDIYEAGLDEGDLTFENDIRDNTRRFDVGLVGGLGWKFKKAFEMDVRYCQDFLDIDKTGEKNWNSCVMLNFNIPMGGEKDKDKAAEAPKDEKQAPVEKEPKEKKKKTKLRQVN